jgi:hypothetical protein
MSRKIALSLVLLLAALLAGSCQPVASTENEKSVNAQTKAQTTPSAVVNSTAAAPSTNAAAPSSNVVASSANAAAPAATPAAVPCPATESDAKRKLLIDAPCDGAKVAQRHFVQGVVTDAKAQVWVIVHPMETSDYWAQPNVTVRDGGKWKVLAYFGEPGAQHSGKSFEVRAVANPKLPLKEGQMLAKWPEAESTSQTIEVVRE